MNREAWGKGWMSRERKRQSLGQERPPRSLKRSNFTKDPRESRTENQMVTPLGDIIRQRHTSTAALCTSYANNVYRETVARRNSCQGEQLLDRKA